ncbi:hypothetical protein GCM10011247_06040 [Pseudomonas plecoglossicida]|nr:hypothetical protein GCM10011247_06040 [Pseudomonas plecoglossicida]
MSQPVSSNLDDNFETFCAGPVNSPWIGYGGGDYQVNGNFTVSLYASQLKDVWNQYYAGTSVAYPLSDDLALIGPRGSIWLFSCPSHFNGF